MRYSVFGDTHVGKVRDHNEDAFFVSEEGGFFIVSDGMGGLKAGEVASAITRDVVSEALTNEEIANLEVAIKEAFSKANEKVIQYSEENQSMKGMGCTCVALALKDNEFYLGHVGDSRAYLYRKGILKQITRDHSYVEELFSRGLIKEEEKKDHPYKNSITRYIGSKDKLSVDVISGPISNDDIFILCSDGLTGEVDDKGIETILKTNSETEKISKALIEKALENGGGDNITVVVVKIIRKKPGFFKQMFGWDI